MEYALKHVTTIMLMTLKTISVYIVQDGVKSILFIQDHQDVSKNVMTTTAI